MIDFSEPQLINGYAYSGNSPITLFDPDGRRPKLPSGGGSGAAAGAAMGPIYVSPAMLKGAILFGAGRIALLIESGALEVDGDSSPGNAATGTEASVAVDDSTPSGVTIVGADGKPLPHSDPTAERIKPHADKALAEWGSGKLGFSPEQEAKIRASSDPYGLSQRLKGSILDKRTKEIIEEEDAELAKKLFTAVAGVYGPDWTNVSPANEREHGEAGWYDLTTRGGWKGHVKKYSGTLGNGVGIIWNSAVAPIASPFARFGIDEGR